MTVDVVIYTLVLCRRFYSHIRKYTRIKNCVYVKYTALGQTLLYVPT